VGEPREPSPFTLDEDDYADEHAFDRDEELGDIDWRDTL
jgi:hypothetical protein